MSRVFNTSQLRKATILLALAAMLEASPAAAASYKQPGFTEKVVFTGLVNPAVVRFLPDGRVLVAEKSGLIKMFDSLTDPTPTVVADLRTNVHNFWDRGLLGMAVPPGFDAASPDEWRRNIYVLYAHDALIGGTAPKWGSPGVSSDPCPSPPNGPGPTTDGCVVSGRLSKLLVSGPDWAANEQVLIEDWCQQFPSHSTGALAFGADEKLYVTGGDGASFNAADWGQFGGTVLTPPPNPVPYTPRNPCGDPPGGVGGAMTKPTARGGALRSQSPRRPAGEARLLDGNLLRVDPATGDPLPDNPLFGSADENEQRTVGFGFRNPFRMIVKPGTNEVWVADVGWGNWEEINRVPDTTTARNFGWPCYEGTGTTGGYNGSPPNDLAMCTSLYGEGSATLPHYTYNHAAPVVAGDGCTVGSSSVAGMAFYQGASNYPENYEDALFFSDYSRKCIWVMFPDESGVPDPSTRVAFASTVGAGPVDLEVGPDGNVYFVGFDGGSIVRIVHGLNAIAVATSPIVGPVPLTISFDGTGSQVASPGDTIFYAWDLDGDGLFDDSTSATPSFEYASAGDVTVRLRVTDNHGGFDVSDPLVVHPGNQPPTATILTPLPSFTWKVGDTIAFTGEASDPETGPLPATALDWEILIHHCPSDCHTHTYQTFTGVAGGSVSGPDHEYPAFIEIKLTATDSAGLTHTTSVNVQPQTVDLSFETSPTGLQLFVGTAQSAAPFTRTVIVGSLVGVDALSPQGTFPNVWEFSSWSDGGAQSHTVTAPAAPATYTATYLTHADLGIAMSAAPEPVGAGAALSYAITVSNAGPSQASSVSVTHTAPPGTSFVTAGGAGWSCLGTGPVTCTLPALGIGAAPALSVVVTAPAEAGPISATAVVTSATDDPAAGNNDAEAGSTVFARADLSLTQSGAPPEICTGQPIAYTISVANAGPSTADSLSVTDTLPAGAALVSATGTGWSCSGTTTVTCTRPTLAVGPAPDITVSITAPSSPGSAVNAAAVSAATSDPSGANNSQNASTEVNAIPSPPAAGTGGAVCIGETLELTASTVPGATYAWTGPNGFVSSLQNPTIPGVTLAAAGLYGVTVTTDGCTSSPATTTAIVREPPTATVFGTAQICAGGVTLIQATLTGTGPWTVVWSDGVTQTDVPSSPAVRTVSPAATTAYSVTALSDATCAGTSAGSAAVTVHPLPTAAVFGSAEICLGGSVQISAALTGAGPWNLTWSDGLVQSAGTSPAVRTVSPLATTTYIVTQVADAHCAAPGTGAAEVVVGAPVALPAITAPVSAAVGATGLTASAELHDGATYAWTLTGGTITGGQGSSQITFDAGAPGTTMVLELVETDTGCSSPEASAKIQVDFLDVPPPHIFHDFVNTVARNGVTAGCGAGNYCPDNPNTRAQMAVFLLKSKLGAAHVPPPATGTVFADVPASDPFAPWIEELAALGVTGGCGGGNYCPGAPVTRAQMAVFLLKTFEGSSYAPPPATGTIFGDVPQGAFAASWIEELYNRDVTGGCQASPLLYCPGNSVTRGQMSVFLVKTFGLL